MSKQINSEYTKNIFWKRWYKILDCLRQCDFNNGMKVFGIKDIKNGSNILNEIFEKVIFVNTLSNEFFINKIDLTSSDCLSTGEIELITYSFIESSFKLFIKYSLNTINYTRLNIFKDTIINILKFLRLNDGKFHNYILNQIFEFLITINQIQNDFLEKRDKKILLDNIQQFDYYTNELRKLNKNDYLLDVKVSINNLKLIRLCYMDLLEILSSIIEPIHDLSEYSLKVNQLIELNLICSTKEMDNSLIDFLINCYFIYNYKSICFQNYFQFICTITDRYSSSNQLNSSTSINQQLDKLWNSFFNSIDLLYEDEKKNQLLFYLVDNVINLKKIKNQYFLQFIQPNILLKIYKSFLISSHYSYQSIDVRLFITRILDYYRLNLSNTQLQSDNYCKLMKYCLIQDYYNETNLSAFNYSNFFKLWDYLNQNSDNFLFRSIDCLIQTINYTNILIPCFHLILIKDELPNFFDFNLISSLVNLLIEEFKRPSPSNEDLKDDLIEHIYIVLDNFIKLTTHLDYELTTEQIAVLFLPWHEMKLIFIKDNHQIINELTRRNFKKTKKIYQICISSIVRLNFILHHKFQLDFFDFILNNQFDELEEFIKLEFINYMLIATRFSETKFNNWFKFIIKIDDKKFISSILGKLSCLLFKECESFYQTVNDENNIEFDFNCVTCSSIEGTISDVKNVNLELLNLLKTEFKNYLKSDDLDNLSVLVEKSSVQFFNHIDIDDELILNILELFDVVKPEMKTILNQLLNNMFDINLKIEREKFFSKFKIKFLDHKLTETILEEQISKFENIALICQYFPKQKLQIIIYLIKNSILNNFDFFSYLSIIINNIENNKSSYFLEHKDKICEEILIEILNSDLKENQAFDSFKKLLHIFTDHKNCFDQLFKHTFHVLIPFLIKQATDRSKSFLEYILTIVNYNNNNYVNLIKGCVNSLIFYFVRNMSIDEIKNSLDYLNEFTKVDIRKIIQERPKLVYYFLFEYGNQEKSTNYLLSILNDQDRIEPNRFIDFNENSEALSNYLTNNMGGYLVHLRTAFVENKKSIKSKILILKSLNSIIKQISIETISSYFEKLIAILRDAFKCQSIDENNNEDFIHHIQIVWETLIAKCDKQDLAKNLSVICKNLMDLLPLNTAAVSKVFTKLIVENERYLGESLKEIHFLPRNCRLLNSVYNVCDKYMIKMPEPDRDIKKFEAALKFLANCIESSENPEIKYFHYKKLLQLLNENESSLKSFCSLSSNDLSVQPIISKLIFKLISDSKNEDAKLRTIIGECLGEFGALDPGRLEFSNQLRKKSENIDFFLGSISKDDTEFALLLINKLVSLFDSINESGLQDCINYALQEILKNYEVKKDNKYNGAIWSFLQPRCKSICQQLFNSKFYLQFQIAKPPHPVFKESPNYFDWIVNWCISLISKVNDDFARDIFNSLCPLIRFYLSFAEYILPFLILFILINGKDEDKSHVYEEMDYVIKNCLPNQQNHQLMEVDQENKENDEENNLISNHQSTAVFYEHNTRSEQYKCVHTLFNLIDFLTNWCKRNKNQLTIKNKIVSKQQKLPIDKKKLWERYNSINDFINKISKSELSLLAATCQSYDRSLMYLEEFIFENKGQLQNNFDNLQNLYVKLEESDAVEGIIVCRKEEPSLYNSILSHEVNGELQEAISCCEKANKIYPAELNYSKIYLRCLLLLGHENTAKIFAKNSIEQSEYAQELQPFIVEAAWKMSDWNNLEAELESKYLEGVDQKFEVGIGRLFIGIRKNDHEYFKNNIEFLRKNEVDQISVSSIDSRAYVKNYTKLVRLHMLNEIEHFYKNYGNPKLKKDLIPLLSKRFTFRTKIVQTSVSLKEPLINLHRVLLNICSTSLSSNNYESELAKLWLTSAKLARKSNNFQSAYNFLLEIQILEQNNFSFSKDLRAKIVIEKAKYHWAKDTLEEKEKAIKELSRGIEQLDLKKDEIVRNKKEYKDCLTFGKLHLLYNNYSEKTLNLDCDTLSQNYSWIAGCYSEWEESYYNLGIYFDNIAKTIDQPADKADLLEGVIKNLGYSLKYGSKHVYESMPKLLTAWFDLGDYKSNLSKMKPSGSRAKKEKEENDLKIIENHCKTSLSMIKQFLEQIAPFNFHTAISQLTSRMCHQCPEISNQIGEIIAKLVKFYPHQTIWFLLSSLLSENQSRKEKCTKLINKVGVDFNLVQNYINFGGILCRICKYEADSSTFNLDEEFPGLKKILEHSHINNRQFIVPFQCFMDVRIGSDNINQTSNLTSSIKENHIFIQKFDNNVQLLKSLVKPKKITMVGTDGKTYVMMCKPKDDLRKDNRTMEFNNLINRLLRKDSETRKRNLFIKTYTVIPLRHDCGLIEWINDLEGYRVTVLGTYKENMENFSLSWEKILADYPKKERSIEDSVKTFKEKILPIFPPIYHKWFLNQYPNPTAWYDARLNYVRSCAVMSIVGYIIGLGDRHGENILIHLKTGNLVHVDFNCIFNKGAELDVPEVVPFRLTHNMVDAMGPTGYEGVFRKTCESTLRVMREQREALMSVLTTFVHDPLIEWNKSSKSSRFQNRKANTENELYEATNKTAIENLDRIRYRLNGLLGLDCKKDEFNSKLNKSIISQQQSFIMHQTQNNNNNKIPISVNYQVSYLIDEATNIRRLSRMYVGWGSFY